MRIVRTVVAVFTVRTVLTIVNGSCECTILDGCSVAIMRSEPNVRNGVAESTEPTGVIERIVVIVCTVSIVRNVARVRIISIDRTVFTVRIVLTGAIVRNGIVVRTVLVVRGKIAGEALQAAI